MTSEPSVFRNAAISYIRIPATDTAESAAFYGKVFGWQIHHNSDTPSFTDGSGHTIGHFVTDQHPTGPDGVRPYIYVDDLDKALEAASAAGAAISTPPYPEGNLTVATILDPSNNTIGLWTQTAA
jgi:predicted enzyme related to lactoylglutathione lyase